MIICLGLIPQMVRSFLLKSYKNSPCSNFDWTIISGHNFVHGTTTELSWHVQNCDMILMIIFHVRAARIFVKFGIFTKFGLWALKQFVGWIMWIPGGIWQSRGIWGGLRRDWPQLHLHDWPSRDSQLLIGNRSYITGVDLRSAKWDEKWSLHKIVSHKIEWDYLHVKIASQGPMS